MPKHRGPHESRYIQELVNRIEDRIFEMFGAQGKSKYSDRVACIHPSTLSRALSAPQRRAGFAGTSL